MPNPSDAPRTRLEAELRVRSWGRERALTLLHRKARELGLTGFTLGLRQFDRYLAAQSTRTRPVTAEVLHALFDLPAETLLAPPEKSPAEGPRAGRPYADPHRPRGTAVRPLPDAGPDAVDGSAGALLTRAAGDASRDHAAAFAVGDAAPSLLDQLHAEARRHARDYAHSPPAVLLPRLLRTRDLVYRLLADAHRPRHSAALLAVAAEVCGLAATTSVDLGDADAADDHARAAWTYADLAEHGPLRAWVGGVRATVALWARRPAEALAHTAAGLRDAPEGGTARRLHALAGRAHALRGDAAATRTALAAARAAGPGAAAGDGLAERLGGEFAFTPARLELCAAAAHLALGEADAACRGAEAALALFAAVPADQQRFGVRHGAALDLAAGRMLRGELDAVPEALGPALRLEPERRTRRLTERLGGIRSRLGGARFRGAAAARDVREAIDAFTAEALPAATPGGGPGLRR